jgi:hypothetical protein
MSDGVGCFIDGEPKWIPTVASQRERRPQRPPRARVRELQIRRGGTTGMTVMKSCGWGPGRPRRARVGHRAPPHSTRRSRRTRRA